jgi:hypothetical protein
LITFELLGGEPFAARDRGQQALVVGVGHPEHLARPAVVAIVDRSIAIVSGSARS